MPDSTPTNTPAADNQSTPTSKPPVTPPNMEPPKAKDSAKGMDPKKRMWLIIAIVVIVLGVGIGVAVALMNNHSTSTSPTDSPTPSASPTPATKASLLDGTMVANDLAMRHPLAIMVENTPDARPQSGLSSASIVYEAIVEGGITRFMAVYGPTLPAKVGPVRSTRQVFVDLIKEFTPTSAYYAHVGGAPDALATIKADKLYDLDQFAVGDKAFQRFPQNGVAIEHTMYTFPDKLYTVAQADGYKSDNTMRSWQFKDDADSTSRPDSQTIFVPFSGGSYDVTYTYDKPTNTYKRSVQGKDFKDALTNAALAPKNVVVQYTTYGTRANDEKGRQDVAITAGGKAKVFRDGQVIDATWAKDKTSNRTIFTEASTGKEVTLDRGQTFVEIVKTDANVTVK